MSKDRLASDLRILVNGINRDRGWAERRAARDREWLAARVARIRRRVPPCGNPPIHHAYASEDVPALLAEVDRLRAALVQAVNEGRNVLPDATDDRAAVIEAWALGKERGGGVCEDPGLADIDIPPLHE